MRDSMQNGWVSIGFLMINLTEFDWLPASLKLEAVCFMIFSSTYSDQLSKALSALPPEMHGYKQTHTFADSVQAYLDQF